MDADMISITAVRFPTALRGAPLPLTRALFLLILVVSWLQTARGQYEVRQWANFEDGNLPPDAITVGASPGERLKVVDLATVEGMPPEFRSPEAVRETQHKALRLRAGPIPGSSSANHCGLILGIVLDRNQLGEKGRALFQADFFVPAGKHAPSLAVLAAEPQGAKKTIREVAKTFYRFGFTLGNRLYYSLVLASGETKNFVPDPALFTRIPRPAWHRFALVFEGADKFSCYIDGQKTSFSPVTDGSVRQMVVGVLCVDKTESYDCYVDNLSIQVSNEAPEKPASPYASTWSSTGAGPSMQPVATPSLDGLQWPEPEEAWTKAQMAKKPLLLYFQAPGIPNVQALDNILQTDPDAREFLASHVCARVDVNQLKGGTIAKQYGVFRVPTMIVIAPDTSWHKRATFSKNTTWKQLETDLRK